MSLYQRPFYVWHLEVEYPPCDAQGVPDNEAARKFAEANDGHFWWPRHTRSLSERTAHRHARKLEQYGATVTVVRSNAVTYPQATPDRSVG